MFGVTKIVWRRPQSETSLLHRAFQAAAPWPRRLSTVATDFDKKLSHVHRSTGATKPIDGAGAGGDTGLDTMAEAQSSSERKGFFGFRR